MFNKIRQWWLQKKIRQSRGNEEAWLISFAKIPLLQRLTEDDQVRLRDMAIVFLHKKSFSGAHDLEITKEMQRIIALQACLPILNLGIHWYRGWRSVIVYPAGFRTEHTFTDEAGVLHSEKRTLSGEAWNRGPVILSWDDVKNAGIIDGDNLVIHEFAHKLDMLNGKAKGFPPLHKNMNNKQWSQVFSEAYASFQSRLQNRKASGIDAYAAQSPAEFFSVLSELFFERPDIVHLEYPEIYKLLSEFYKQDTLNYLEPS